MNVVLMPMGSCIDVVDRSPHWRARHFLPGHRQNIPPKSLKNKKNSAPDFIARRVQWLEAVWDVNLRRCGLGIWE
jgi:hypothetical protein